MAEADSDAEIINLLSKLSANKVPESGSMSAHTVRIVDIVQEALLAGNTPLAALLRAHGWTGTQFGSEEQYQTLQNYLRGQLTHAPEPTDKMASSLKTSSLKKPLDSAYFDVLDEDERTEIGNGAFGKVYKYTRTVTGPARPGPPLALARRVQKGFRKVQPSAPCFTVQCFIVLHSQSVLAAFLRAFCDRCDGLAVLQDTGRPVAVKSIKLRNGDTRSVNFRYATPLPPIPTHPHPHPPARSPARCGFSCVFFWRCTLALWMLLE